MKVHPNRRWAKSSTGAGLLAAIIGIAACATSNVASAGQLVQEGSVPVRLRTQDGQTVQNVAINRLFDLVLELDLAPGQLMSLVPNIDNGARSYAIGVQVLLGDEEQAMEFVFIDGPGAGAQNFDVRLVAQNIPQVAIDRWKAGDTLSFRIKYAESHPTGSFRREGDNVVAIYEWRFKGPLLAELDVALAAPDLPMPANDAVLARVTAALDRIRTSYTRNLYSREREFEDAGILGAAAWNSSVVDHALEAAGKRLSATVVRHELPDGADNRMSFGEVRVLGVDACRPSYGEKNKTSCEWKVSAELETDIAWQRDTQVPVLGTVRGAWQRASQPMVCRWRVEMRVDNTSGQLGDAQSWSFDDCTAASAAPTSESDRVKSTGNGCGGHQAALLLLLPFGRRRSTRLRWW